MRQLIAEMRFQQAVSFLTGMEWTKEQAAVLRMLIDMGELPKGDG